MVGDDHLTRAGLTDSSPCFLGRGSGGLLLYLAVFSARFGISEVAALTSTGENPAAPVNGAARIGRWITRSHLTDGLSRAIRERKLVSAHMIRCFGWTGHAEPSRMPARLSMVVQHHEYALVNVRRSEGSEGGSRGLAPLLT